LTPTNSDILFLANFKFLNRFFNFELKVIGIVIFGGAIHKMDAVPVQRGNDARGHRNVCIADRNISAVLLQQAEHKARREYAPWTPHPHIEPRVDFLFRLPRDQPVIFY